MKIAVMGDTLCRAEGGGDPFEHVRPVWERADLRLLNLETVLTDRGTPAPKRTLLRTDPAEAHWLHGVDVVHLANNHVFDYGEIGCADTLQALDDLHIEHIGVMPGNRWEMVVPASHERGFLAFHAYPLQAGQYQAMHIENWERVLVSVEWLSGQLQSIVVSLHWGTEHAPHPSPLQIEQAHVLIDAGATLVVGHGPHRVQTIERYRDGLIAYSLGNFNFLHTDVRSSEFNTWSVILIADVEGRRVTDYELVPVHIDPRGRPLPEQHLAGQLYLEYINTLSQPDITWRQWYEEIGSTYITQSLKSFAYTIPRYGWVRLRKLAWWLRQPHTRRAFAGALRAVRL